MKLALEMEDGQLPELRKNCTVTGDAFGYLTNSGILKVDEEIQSQKSREYRLILWILYRKSVELSQISQNLNHYEFTADELAYESMSTNLLNSDKLIVEKCIEYYETSAIKFERFHLNKLL